MQILYLNDRFEWAFIIIIFFQMIWSVWFAVFSKSLIHANVHVSNFISSIRVSSIHYQYRHQHQSGMTQRLIVWFISLATCINCSNQWVLQPVFQSIVHTSVWCNLWSYGLEVLKVLTLLAKTPPDAHIKPGPDRDWSCNCREWQQLHLFQWTPPLRESPFGLWFRQACRRVGLQNPGPQAFQQELGWNSRHCHVGLPDKPVHPHTTEYCCHLFLGLPRRVLWQHQWVKVFCKEWGTIGWNQINVCLTLFFPASSFHSRSGSR